MFSGLDDEGVKFVEERGAGGQVTFKDCPNLLVRFFPRGQVMTFENSAGVGIHNEHGMIAGIEEDGVGRLWADAMDGKELFAKNISSSVEHSGEGAAVSLAEELDKGSELAGFLAEIARGADEVGKFWFGELFEGLGGKKLVAAQFAEGALDVGPAGILREDGSDDHFEAGAGGPPMLRSVGLEESLVVVLEDGESGRRRGRRMRE